MSEKINSQPNQDEATSQPDIYAGISDTKLRALKKAYEVNCGKEADRGDSPIADMRQELNGKRGLFKSVMGMNNLELLELAKGAGEQLEARESARKIEYLKGVIDAADASTDSSDLRSKLTNLVGFNRIYEMNNLDIADFIKDARQELDGLTQPESDVDNPSETLGTDMAVDKPKESEELNQNEISELIEFDSGDVVMVKRTNGDIEDDWRVADVKNNDEKGMLVTVIKENESGQLIYKTVTYNELVKWQLLDNNHDAIDEHGAEADDEPESKDAEPTLIRENPVVYTKYHVENETASDEQGPILPQGIWQRIQSRLHQEIIDIKEDLRFMSGRVEGPILLGDLERQKKYGAIAAAVGATAVGLAVYLQSRYGIFVAGHETGPNNMPGGEPVPAHAGASVAETVPSGSPIAAGGTESAGGHGGEVAKALRNQLSHAHGDYTWNRFAEVFGPDHASDRLLGAVDEAKQAGVKVIEHGPRSSTGYWLEVIKNGKHYNDTKTVTDVLSKFV